MVDWCAQDVYCVLSAEGGCLVLATGFQHSNNKIIKIGWLIPGH